ncbi:MAG: TraR/DksA family transcriptional regulator [Bdellovibrionales bacterium]
MITTEIIKTCKSKLVELKEDLINRAEINPVVADTSNTSGDEVDIGNQILDENQAIELNLLMRKKLLEIEMALHRIDNGQFGVCEVTGEYIEEKRLLAIPWTRLSLEGAEQLEHNNRRYSLR